MAGVSEFTISPKEAMILVKNQSKEDDGKKCYMMQITFTNVYSDSEVPNSCYRILPRLLNGVPLGAGLMSRDQLQTVRWKYIEGTKNSHTFISQPLLKEDAQETKRGLRDRLIQQSQRIFGDLTVKANIVLSECINYDGDMILNDIAVPNEDGFHFRD